MQGFENKNRLIIPDWKMQNLSVSEIQNFLNADMSPQMINTWVHTHTHTWPYLEMIVKTEAHTKTSL